MSDKKKITVAYGDGIGPEIMEATLKVLEAAGARLEYDVIEIGEKVYNKGIKSGIRPEAWDSLRSNKVFLKAPITTPQGGGYKSLNVTTRKTLGLYANVRPVQTYAPYVTTKHYMDLVIIRENEEDLYAGIEHQQTGDVYQCLKLLSAQGTEKIIRYAFEYARAYNRKKVTCFTKDNIMKITDGMFHKMFDTIGEEFPDIQKDHRIIDIGSALLADTPQNFDVIVTLNLYGDIISDIAAQVAGSVGLCGSSNIGDLCAMFEAIHGSAPDIAGKDIANPSGLINGAIMMLVHIGQQDIAEKIQNAWLKTLEDGIHTADIYRQATSTKKVGTQAFAKAVIERLGQVPQHFKPAKFSNETMRPVELKNSVSFSAKKELVGFDIFVDWNAGSPDDLANSVKNTADESAKLTFISNRGVKVWPDGLPETFCTNHWRLRFKSVSGEPLTRNAIINTLQKMEQAGIDFIKYEGLYAFDGKNGFSEVQGE
jgi:isocitrate dehydrogenase